MKIILASKSGVRKQILEKYGITPKVVISNVDEDQIKESLLSEKVDPLNISKNLAELKSVKVSSKFPDQLVLGADSVISLNDELINKPRSRDDAFKFFQN
jgi:septum formation protein